MKGASQINALGVDCPDTGPGYRAATCQKLHLAHQRVVLGRSVGEKLLLLVMYS